jgi:DNA polymerase-3 subunit epsilon
LVDDGKIVKTYEQFVNPETEIPRHIVTLTGITDEDVEDAPLFKEISDEVSELLRDRIFVAQNVNFDYSFIKNEFERIGSTFQAKRLCTSRYARSRINGLKRSSLKVLAEHFQVVNENPHRALSDAITAAKILVELIAIDDDLEIASKLVNQQETKITLPNNANPEDYKKLPSRPGVYFFYGEDGKPIYIGKAKNLKSRVSSHFNGSLSSKRTQAFLREIYAIKFRETGSDLLAYLLEDTLIRKHWPIHNSAQKSRVKKFGVISYKDQNGNYRLAVNPIRQNETALKVFYYFSTAMQWLHETTVNLKLKPEYVGLMSLAAEIGTSDKEHNEKIERLAEQFKAVAEVQFLREKGRSKNETAWIAIQNESAIAFTFLPNGEKPRFDSCELLQPSATTNKILENHLQKIGESYFPSLNN